MQLLFDDGVEDLSPRRVQDPAASAPEGRWGARAVILLGPRLPLGPRSGGSRDGGVRAGGLLGLPRSEGFAPLVHFGFRVEEFLGRRQPGLSGALQGVDAGAAAGRGSLLSGRSPDTESSGGRGAGGLRRRRGANWLRWTRPAGMVGTKPAGMVGAVGNGRTGCASIGLSLALGVCFMALALAAAAPPFGLRRGSWVCGSLALALGSARGWSGGGWCGCGILTPASSAAAISSACWGRSCVGFGGAIGVTTVLSMMGPLQWGQAKTCFMLGV